MISNFSDCWSFSRFSPKPRRDFSFPDAASRFFCNASCCAVSASILCRSSGISACGCWNGCLFDELQSDVSTTESVGAYRIKGAFLNQTFGIELVQHRGADRILLKSSICLTGYLRLVERSCLSIQLASPQARQSLDFTQSRNFVAITGPARPIAKIFAENSR